MKALSTEEMGWLREFLASPMSGKRQLHVRKGALLFAKGQTIKHIFLISRGQIRVDASSPHGRVVLIQQCGPLDWLAEGALDDENVHAYTATALMDTDLHAFARDTFPKLLHEHPHLQHIFTVGMAKSARAMREVLDNQLLSPAHKRLARVLLDMFGDRTSQEMLIEATPSRLGDMVGITRQTAHKLINAFRSAGMLTKQDSERYILHRAELEKFLRWADSPAANTAHELAHYLLTGSDK